MDHPYYSLTVASLTRGWSYSLTEGTATDPDDAVLLVDPMTYSWTFKGELLPGQLDVSTANVNLAGKTADALPEVQVGDLITIDVRVGTSGPRIIAPPPFRAAEPVVTLGKGTYPARMTIPLSDLSVDWRSRNVGPPLGQPTTNPGGDKRNARPYWRERGAELAVVISGGLSLGCPTWWGNSEDPVSANTDSVGRYFGGLAYDPYGSKMYEGSAADVLERFINSHQPSGFTHTWVTVYNPAGHPTGYRRIGPDTWASLSDPSTAVPIGVLSDPGGSLRVEAVPASRMLPSAAGLPLRLVISGGRLELEPRDSSGTASSSTQAALDAEWCIIPATARRARDSVTNTLNILGYGRQPTGETSGTSAVYDWSDFGRTFQDTTDAATRGPLQRDLPTMLFLGLSDTAFGTGSGNTGGTAELSLVAANFLSDPTALAASWSYDAFTVLSSLIPQSVATWLLPIMAPRLPGETNGDGRLVRNVTLYDIAADLRFGGSPVTGFVTAGSLTISGGEMTWQLRTAPGRPIYTGGTPSPVTVAEFEAVVSGSGLTIDDVDPLITFADLDYVDS